MTVAPRLACPIGEENGRIPGTPDLTRAGLPMFTRNGGSSAVRLRACARAGLIGLFGRNRALVGFVGIKNRPWSSIGRDLDGEARELIVARSSAVSANDDSRCSY